MANPARKTYKRHRSDKRRKGKSLTTKKQKGGKRRKHSRKQRGGVCFGNGVGANNGDPNFSVYNTNLLKLFPYRPEN
jgi:hypothetical protein